LRCAFCQNWEISFRDARDGGKLAAPNLPPERAIELALEQHCEGIAWTFNEPSISPMYTLDCAKLAHEAGLYTVMVTNGWMTNEALQLLGPYIDVYRIDIKSLDASFYRRVAGSTQCDTMFPVAQRAQQEFNVHIETVTNLMPSLNDGDKHLARLAERIAHTFGENTPWHLTSYVPYAYMTNISPTPPEALRRARAIGLQAGLRFVYTDDITAPETAHTFCPTCGTCVVERSARQIHICGLASTGRCAQCDTSLGMIIASTFISHLSEEV
jgi:pyruvate formate lyase activating enzyme